MNETHTDNPFKLLTEALFFVRLDLADGSEAPITDPTTRYAILQLAGNLIKDFPHYQPNGREKLMHLVRHWLSSPIRSLNTNAPPNDVYPYLPCKHHPEGQHLGYSVCVHITNEGAIPGIHEPPTNTLFGGGVIVCPSCAPYYQEQGEPPDGSNFVTMCTHCVEDRHLLETCQ